MHARLVMPRLAAVLAALVGIGRVARPEPVIRALVLVQDGLGPIGYKLYTPWHNLTRMGQNRETGPHPQGLPAVSLDSLGQVVLYRGSKKRSNRREVPPPLLGACPSRRQGIALGASTRRCGQLGVARISRKCRCSVSLLGGRHRDGPRCRLKAPSGFTHYSE